MSFQYRCSGNCQFLLYFLFLSFHQPFISQNRINSHREYTNKSETIEFFVIGNSARSGRSDRSRSEWWHSFLQRAALCTSRGAFAHLRTTPLCWRAHDIAVTMCRKECHQFLHSPFEDVRYWCMTILAKVNYPKYSLFVKSKLCYLQNLTFYFYQKLQICFHKKTDFKITETV